MTSHDKPEAAPPRKRGRPRLDAQMVPRILDAAERLIARRGTSVSIRDMAAEAGIHHSAIYHYFSSKDDILRQMLQRGRDRQTRHEIEAREAGRPFDGAVEWLMTTNRAFLMGLARAALEGETPSSLGLAASDSAGRRSLRVLQDRVVAPELRTDHDPHVITAAVTALSLGWVTGEDWIVDALGMAGCDRQALRRDIDEVLASLWAMGSGPTGPHEAADGAESEHR